MCILSDAQKKKNIQERNNGRSPDYTTKHYEYPTQCVGICCVHGCVHISFENKRYSICYIELWLWALAVLRNVYKTELLCLSFTL